MIETVRANWDRFWFAPFEVPNANAFRILLGAFLLSTHLNMLRSMSSMFGEGSMMLWLAGALASLGFTIGWKTQICAAVLLLVRATFASLNPFLMGIGDVLAQNFLLISCFAPYSSVWSVRLIQISLCSLYFFSGVSKLVLSPEWFPEGSAIYYVFSSPIGAWVSPAALRSAWLHGSLQFLTYATVIVEIALPFFLWPRRTRPYAVLVAFLLHASIVVFVPIAGYFSIIAIAGLSTFLPAEWGTKRFSTPR